jgi:hypothetical protein
MRVKEIGLEGIRIAIKTMKPGEQIYLKLTH